MSPLFGARRPGRDLLQNSISLPGLRAREDMTTRRRSLYLFVCSSPPAAAAAPPPPPAALATAGRASLTSAGQLAASSPQPSGAIELGAGRDTFPFVLPPRSRAARTQSTSNSIGSHPLSTFLARQAREPDGSRARPVGAADKMRPLARRAPSDVGGRLCARGFLVSRSPGAGNGEMSLMLGQLAAPARSTPTK